jgi:hypothetical protein
VGANPANFLLTAGDAATGEIRGVAADLGRELGRRLAVPVEIIGYPSPGAPADAAKSGNAFARFVRERLDALAGLRPRLVKDENRRVGEGGQPAQPVAARITAHGFED